MAFSLKNNAFSKYLRECYQELQKVVWPSKETVQKHTILVIAISLFVAAYFGVLDYGLNQLLERLISL